MAEKERNKEGRPRAGGGPVFGIMKGAILPRLLIGVYPSTLLFGEHASMRARILAAHQKTTAHRRIPAMVGL